MYLAGFISVLLALLASVGGAGFALLQLWDNHQTNDTIIRKFSWIICGSLLFSSAALLHALFWQDYSWEYVYSYTDQYLPLFYRLTAFWAGQPGSMLFWATVASLCGWLWSCNASAKSLTWSTQLWFWAFFYFIMAFFCLLLACYSNPFIILDPPPADGNGLNPLLQNPGMIIHPPLLFIGYALFIVPTCLALAQQAGTRTQNQEWFANTRHYIIGGWVFLSAGIIIGAWWAYMELGWGGYWAWDPVENSSLLPWLSATALLHILLVEKKSGKLARTSVFLISLTTLLTFFGTWLTRSGIIESVHAFGDGGVGIPLLIFIVFFSFLTILTLFSSRSVNRELAHPISREGFILLTTWILLALAFIVILATLWPLVGKMGHGLSQGLNAEFYNRVCLPIFSLLLVFLAICRLFGWNGGINKGWPNIDAIIIGCAFLFSCALFWTLGYQRILPLLASGAACAVLMATLMEIIRSRWWKFPIKTASLGAHLGTGLMALGIAFSSGYATDHELVLAQGEKTDAGAYSVTLDHIIDGAGPGYDYLKAEMTLTKNGEVVGSLAPERRIYAKYGTMQFSEVDVISTLSKDIYASLLGMDEEHKVLIRLSFEPLVSWIWIGGLILCLIPLFGLRNYPEIYQHAEAPNPDSLIGITEKSELQSASRTGKRNRKANKT